MKPSFPFGSVVASPGVVDARNNPAAIVGSPTHQANGLPDHQDSIANDFIPDDDSGNFC